MVKNKNLFQKMIGSKGAWIGGIIPLIFLYYIQGNLVAGGGGFNAVDTPLAGYIVAIIIGFISGYFIEKQFFKKK